MKIVIGILFTLCLSQVALADTTYVCTSGGMERKIEVVYLNTGTVPCEVRYTKDGNTEVLWTAQAEEGFCDDRATEFVEKQRGWGWVCEESMKAMSEPASKEMPTEPSDMMESMPTEPSDTMESMPTEPSDMMESMPTEPSDMHDDMPME